MMSAHIMDDFGDMERLLADPDALDALVADGEVSRQIRDITDQIRDIPVPPRTVRICVMQYNPATNLLVPDIRNTFRFERVYEETDMITAPTATTCTVGGFLTSVRVHEQRLLNMLDPDEHIIAMACNYGTKCLPGCERFLAHKPRRKTRRGRERKKQGRGEDFNSQITLTVMPRQGARTYKIKIFRTGPIQLPGVQPEYVEDIIACLDIVVARLNAILWPGISDPEVLIKPVNLNPVMKNYKFRVKIPPGHIIDLDRLRSILQKIIEGQPTQYTAGDFYIHYVKYGRDEPKLSVKFCTPVWGLPMKRARWNIFPGGKINVLGGLDNMIDSVICQNIDRIMRENYTDIVIPVDDFAARMARPDNVVMFDEDLCELQCEYYRTYPVMIDLFPERYARLGLDNLSTDERVENEHKDT